MRHQYAKCSFVLRDILKSYFSRSVRNFFSWLKRSFLLYVFIILVFKRSMYHSRRTWKETFTNFYTFSNASKCLTSNMCNIYTKVLRTRLLRKYNKFSCCVVYFLITHGIGEHYRQIANGVSVVEKHARLCSVGRSVCKKWSL